MKKILMGSLVLTVLAVAIIAVQMSSCTKTTGQTTTVYDTVKITVHDTVCPNTYPIAGLWMGTSTDASNITEPFNLSIKADGTCTAEGIEAGPVEILGYGTWTLQGTTFNLSLNWVYSSTSAAAFSATQTAVFNSTTATLSGGTWTAVSTTGGRDAGTFTLARVN